MTKLTPNQIVDLEGLIDLTSLAAVLTALEAICDGKAEHLQANWQDPNTAREWHLAARRLGKCAAKQNEGL